MNFALIVAILLVFCLIAFVIGYNVGFKKGAEGVIEQWRAWLNEFERVE